MGLLRADLLKLARHSLPRSLAIILLLLVLLRGLVWPPAPNVPWVGLWSYTLIVAALVMLTAVTVGTEFSEDTFRSLVGRGVPRGWLLLSKFASMILFGGVLLVVFEGLATLLGVRPELHWGDLGRAWLSLCPYVSLIMLLTVLARSGGLALVFGVLMIGLEQFSAMLMSGMAMLAELPQFRFLTHRGFAGELFQWTLSFNSTNWTYLAESQRAPMPTNVLLWAMPHPAARSAVILAAYTLFGLGLSILVVYRRDLTEAVEGKRGLLAFLKRGVRREEAHRQTRREVLPRWTGRGPILVRLARGHLFRAGRTPLLKIGFVVSLIFPLALWGIARLLGAAGFEDVLFVSEFEGGSPLSIAISLLLVGPLATVLAILAIGNELSLGTRRAELTRGATRAQTILAQSLALMLAVGGMFALVMAIVVVMGAWTTGFWPVGSAALTVLVATLATGAYVGVVQVGGALTRSPLGATLFGLLFLVADWMAILTPTLMMEDPGILLDLGRYAVFANTFSLASKGHIVGVDIAWQHLSPPGAILLLLGYIVAGHALATFIANRRDA
jgi:ABC-type transport system involved in multi-copper enzyme maturation permease subunit